ncbi:hypothetical protein HMPREF0281_02196 [Corynebacterium ammoniagenes DSM 20306]|uniref:Uncharacterized protein n=1 Tax=Corynebacterium ammoniagenes DSM 20306 TaxID=649754 RepID=A0ABN0ADR2_CORAM|nr:hypothetical protein HMPREF0281_02196 [Corynebacterium ammoniagenes DSM 20306]
MARTSSSFRITPNGSAFCMLGRCSIFTPSPSKEVDALRDLAVNT